MREFPQAFIDQAMEGVREELFANMASGLLRSNRHYLMIALEIIFAKYAVVSNEETDLESDRAASLQDVSWFLRQKGYHIGWHNDDLMLPMGNLTFVLTPDDYQGITVSLFSEDHFTTRPYYFNPTLFMSARAIIRLIERYSASAAAFGESLTQVITGLCKDFKQAQIALKSISMYFEKPEMRQLPLMYGCKVDNEGVKILIWIYNQPFLPEDNTYYPSLEINVPYYAFQDAPGYIAQAVKILCSDNSRYDEYPQWAKRVINFNAPTYNETTKLAGIF